MNMDNTNLFSILREIKFTEGAYLVGGTVRDMVIGRDPVDIDIAVSGDADRFARTLAKKIDGSLFPLDKERGVYRIATKKGKTHSCYYDISPIRGGDIYRDLSLRDFTVDAMAVSLEDDVKTIIDPYKGQADIKGKCIRIISRKSFEDDPLRLLRAFRLASTLDFEIDRGTFNTIREMSSLLRLPARERIRDEFFRLLSDSKSIQYLKHMQNAGLLKEILIGLDDLDIEKGLIVFNRLECLYNSFHASFSLFDLDIKKYLLTRVEEGITNASMWKWISLFQIPLNPALLNGEAGVLKGGFGNGVRDEIIINGLKNMRLGNRARRLALLAVKNKQTCFPDNSIEDKRNLYHFFKATGDDGIGLILCQIATIQESTERYDTALKNGKDAISWYLYDFKKMQETPLISGNDLIELFSLSPGPEFSYLLDIVAENRAVGKITTKRDAITFLKKLMTNV